MNARLGPKSSRRAISWIKTSIAGEGGTGAAFNGPGAG